MNASAGRSHSDKPLRVHVDLAAVVRVDADARRASEPAASRDHLNAFGSAWGRGGVGETIAGKVQWTLHVGELDSATKALLLTAIDILVGYFFAGGRLLVDRSYRRGDCDMYITGMGSLPHVDELQTDVIRIGSTEYADWDAVIAEVTRRATG